MVIGVASPAGSEPAHTAPGATVATVRICRLISLSAVLDGSQIQDHSVYIPDHGGTAARDPRCVLLLAQIWHAPTRRLSATALDLSGARVSMASSRLARGPAAGPQSL